MEWNQAFRWKNNFVKRGVTMFFFIYICSLFKISFQSFIWRFSVKKTEFYCSHNYSIFMFIICKCYCTFVLNLKTFLYKNNLYSTELSRPMIDKADLGSTRGRPQWKTKWWCQRSLAEDYTCRRTSLPV